MYSEFFNELAFYKTKNRGKGNKLFESLRMSMYTLKYC